MLIAGQLAAAVVIDRIAAIVGNQVIKSSDVARDLRVTAFLNGQPIASTPADKRKAADRLIEQRIIRTELATGNYGRATDADAQKLYEQIRQQRFAGSDARMTAALQRYELTPAQLKEQLLWQLTVLHFIDQRFRPGILVTDDEVRAYYDQHHADLARENPKDASFETLAPKVRESLEGERIDKEFDTWVGNARKRNRIEYRDEAFQ